MEIDMIKAYGVRVIEGVPIQDILENGVSTVHGVSAPISGNNQITKYFVCVKDYFVPYKSCYKLNNTSNCSFCRRAMNYDDEANCLDCFKYCIANREVKKQRLIVKPPL